MDGSRLELRRVRLLRYFEHPCFLPFRRVYTRPDGRRNFRGSSGHDIGAAWNKTSEAGREYKSVTLDDPSFPAPIYARLIEGEDGTHDLIWSRTKPQAA
ncbi:DUF736 family protein [Burkholderia multivorans]|nr:DUF736 family protein [Burkholderia multivorans]